MEIVIFIGIQATGKSSFYKEKFFKSHIRINLDMLKTRRKEDILLDSCIKARQSFVVDNTNPTDSDRKKYIDLAKSAGFKVIGYYFITDIHEALLRNESRKGKERIPVVAIRGTHAKMQAPCLEEGFDELYVVRIEEGSFVVEEFKG